MSQPAPLFIDLGLTYGAILTSTFISSALWGATCLQTIFYFVTYRYETDALILKILVALLWILNTAHQILITKGIWTTLIPRYGDPGPLGIIEPGFMYELVPKFIIAFIVQVFFARRIYLLSRDTWILPLTLGPMILWQPMGSIAYIILGEKAGTAAGLSEYKITTLAYAVNGVATAVDIFIALCMCVLLYRGRTGFEATDRLRYRLMVSSFNTGFWPALFALITIILMATRPHDLTYCITDFSISALYCNSLLANINSREFINSRPLHSSGSARSALELSNITRRQLEAGKGTGNEITSATINFQTEHFKGRDVEEMAI